MVGQITGLGLMTCVGSATERWHNILRTGLDFQETANARVSPFPQDYSEADVRRRELITEHLI